jgi:Flp pilus assembly pilin Flp
VRHRLSSSHDEQGAVAVEFALLLPIFIVLVMGVVEFGRGYNATVELTGAVREGARALALGRPPGEAESAIVAASPGLDPPPRVVVNQECPHATDRASITAMYRLHYDIPFFRQGFWDISRTGVMRCGG